MHRVDSLLIVFDSKLSLTHCTFGKIKCLCQVHICIILLYLIFHFSKFMFKSCLVAHKNWVSVRSFLVPGNCKNAGFFTIYPRAYGALNGPQTSCRKATSARWGRVTRLLNRFEYTSFWGSYASDRQSNGEKKNDKIKKQ